MIELNKQILLNDLKEKFKTIKLNSNVKQIEIKETIIKNEEDLSNALDKCLHDKYSDIDILIRYVNTPNIKLEDIGINKEDILGIKLENNDDSYVVRLVLTNGIRYDIVLFDIDNTTIEKEIDEMDKKELFVAIMALGKLMRKDYLISAHLAHMLCMDSLVYQMKDRDKKYNTSFHRYGYKEDLLYLNAYNKANKTYLTDDETYNHIAKLLISGIETLPNIKNHDKKVFYEIWNYYLK